MCGINVCRGKENIEMMNTLSGHRGVRDTITHLYGDIYLGHVRLPIQGLNPKYDHPYYLGRYLGAMVGEIFNYKHIDPHAESDLPVLMEQFAIQGDQVFRAFDGFWAVMIYDTQTTILDIFTDHLAKKPLYIRWAPFGVSSELKTLANLAPNQFDEIYFSAVAKWGYCPENRTPFKNIYKLPPATRLTINLRTMESRTSEYLTLTPRGNPYRNLPVLIRDAVHNRLVSDVPVSVLMSGGLDSTIIYYLLREITDELTIFHVENAEAEFLNYVDFRPSDKLIKLEIDDKEFDLDDILYFNEGPVDLGSVVPQYLLAKEIQKHGFNVCLSGDGADELFGGYKRIFEYDSQHSDIFHELVYYHLPRLDKLMMAGTVELRCPFLSHRVIEGALALPYVDRIGKNTLKEMFAKVVPVEILRREKKPLRYRVDWRHDLIDCFRAMAERSDWV